MNFPSNYLYVLLSTLRFAFSEGGMKKRISSRIKKFLIRTDNTVSGNISPNLSIGADVREEYANAFRTQSYIDFWTRVITVPNGESPTCIPLGSKSSARLPSYRLFAEHLLDPDQAAVTRILTLTRNRPAIHVLLSDYFTQTANAFILCSLLLKEIEHTRARYRSFKTTLQSLDAVKSFSVNHFPTILTRLTEFSNSVNPFVSSASSPCRVRSIQAGCSELLKRLESSRNNTQAKLRLVKKLKHSSAFVLVALTTSLTVIVVTHALSLVIAMPCLITASKELASSRKLARVITQLDAAAKGTYILNRDLDTISRLVTRLNDELEHMRAMVQVWVERGEDWVQASGEVRHQLKENDWRFREQLDEVEEHMYLCFMTINRARNLVVKEIVSDPGQPIKAPCILSN